MRPPDRGHLKVLHEKRVVVDDPTEFVQGGTLGDVLVLECDRTGPINGGSRFILVDSPTPADLRMDDFDHSNAQEKGDADTGEG